MLMISSAALVTASLSIDGPAAAAPGYPGAQGRCVDRTQVLGAALCARITAVLLADEKRSTDEIAVAVVPTTGDATIESWSTGLFDTWGVGKAAEDNGVLLVVAVDDHRVRLETGRGLIARLPDSAAKEIVDTVITPRFADDAYATGILNGLDEVRRRLGHPLNGVTLAALASQNLDSSAPDSSGATQSDDEAQALFDESESESDVGGAGAGAGGWLIAGFVGLVLIVMVTTLRLSGSRERRVLDHSTHRRRRSNDHHGWAAGSSSSSSSFGGGDSGGSSGSGFGGGSSDGGGSSGSW